jgi:twinkle protein
MGGFVDVLSNDNIDFRRYMEASEPEEKVRSVGMYEAEVLAELAPNDDAKPKHPKLPFANAWLYFAPGEVTVWAGYNGSGKSMLQGQVMSQFAQDGIKGCIASFEMTPAKTISRMIRQNTDHRNPSPTQVQEFIRKTDNSLWVYDQQGAVQPRRLIAVLKYCAEVLGCTQIAVDSLMKCVKGTDDFNGQKEFVDQLTICARDFNIHIHLVAHLKKPDGIGERIPTRYDISGAAAISDLVDNVLIVYRNKAKERDGAAGKTPDDNAADTLLICDKSRNGDWEGRVKLWYDRESQLFTCYNKGARRGLSAALAA